VRLLLLALALAQAPPAKVAASIARVFGRGARIDTVAVASGLALRVSRGDSLLGFAAVREVMGKDQRITFLVAIDPADRLKDVDILVTSREPARVMKTFVSLPAAQSFRRMDDVVEGIEVRAEDLYRSARVATSVEETLGFPYFTRDWKEVFPAFFQALKTERVMMFVLLTMIMVVAAFVIVATLVMMIMEKSSDIAILKAMGASDAAVERIFAIEGTLIGLLGTVLGIVAGVAVTTRLDFIQDQVEALTGIDTLPASVYQFSHFPFEFDLLQIAGVATIAMVLSLGATWLPSRQGSRLDPAEALRYE